MRYNPLIKARLELSCGGTNPFRIAKPVLAEDVLAVIEEVERLREVLRWIAREYQDMGAGMAADSALAGDGLPWRER